jgi:serine/threonine-protein kinase
MQRRLPGGQLPGGGAGVILGTESMTSSATSKRSATPLDLTGKELADYLIIRRLGRGGMADVYLAEQRSLGRKVALKILRPELAEDSVYVQRFEREARAAAALNQANIVQIYEVGQHDSLHFIAQEYVRGQNLKQYLTRHGTVESVLALSILRQVAAALQKAAEYAVIHRDIKPENILLATSGEVKVTDFGLARVLDDNRTDLTQVGITMGTPLYMSPEQVEGKRVDPRSDIYSLGVTAYHMLAGRPPFEGDSPLALAVQHVKQEAAPLEQLRPDLPRELCELIARMMAKSPDDRVQDAGQLVQELRRIPIGEIENWEELASKLAAADTATSDRRREQPTLAETRQLQTIMMGHIVPWWRTRAGILTLVLLGLLALATGSALALVAPPTGPFDELADSSTSVTRKQNAFEQYHLGILLDTEPGWRAVSKFFPPGQDIVGANGEVLSSGPMNLLYSRKADERLAELLIRENRLAEALEIYRRLEQLEPAEEHFRAIGMAGQAVIYDLQGKSDLARAKFAEVEPHRDQLNVFLRRRIDALQEKLRRERASDVELPATNSQP